MHVFETSRGDLKREGGRLARRPAPHPSECRPVRTPQLRTGVRALAAVIAVAGGDRPARAAQLAGRTARTRQSRRARAPAGRRRLAPVPRQRVNSARPRPRSAFAAFARARLCPAPAVSERRAGARRGRAGARAQGLGVPRRPEPAAVSSAPPPCRAAVRTPAGSGRAAVRRRRPRSGPGARQEGVRGYCPPGVRRTPSSCTSGPGAHVAFACSAERGIAMPKKGKKGRGGRGKSHGKKQKKPDVDILSPAAMLNLYYIAHNAADCLYLRGFRWPGAPKGKKGKSKT
nr:small lysine-rich protein 1 [Microcebus murinus]